jgi:hypothetical protein
MGMLGLSGEFFLGRAGATQIVIATKGFRATRDEFWPSQRSPITRSPPVLAGSCDLPPGVLCMLVQTAGQTAARFTYWRRNFWWLASYLP